MIKIYVNEIIEHDNGSKLGAVAWDGTIAEDMLILYDEKVQRGIQHYINNPPHQDGFHIFSRFYHFENHFVFQF